MFNSNFIISQSYHSTYSTFFRFYPILWIFITISTILFKTFISSICIYWYLFPHNAEGIYYSHVPYSSYFIYPGKYPIAFIVSTQMMLAYHFLNFFHLDWIQYFSPMYTYNVFLCLSKNMVSIQDGTIYDGIQWIQELYAWCNSISITPAFRFTIGVLTSFFGYPIIILTIWTLISVFHMITLFGICVVLYHILLKDRLNLFNLHAIGYEWIATETESLGPVLWRGLVKLFLVSAQSVTPYAYMILLGILCYYSYDALKKVVRMLELGFALLLSYLIRFLFTHNWNSKEDLIMKLIEDGSIPFYNETIWPSLLFLSIFIILYMNIDSIVILLHAWMGIWILSSIYPVLKESNALFLLLCSISYTIQTSKRNPLNIIKP